MAVHIAILKPCFIESILQGRKTIESRITRTPRPPLGCIHAGDRLFIKESGGPFRATALAANVEEHRGLTPRKMDALRRRYEPSVGGGDDYWRQRRGHRFAVFITLSDVQPTDRGPSYKKQHMRAWYVLDDGDAPALPDGRDSAGAEGVVVDEPLTAGALRNRYVLLPRELTGAGASFELHLPDGRRVQTSLADGRRVRWRGWGPYFEAHALRPGDAVRFVAVAPGTYRVGFVPCRR